MNMREYTPLEAVKVAIRDASLTDINFPEYDEELWLGDDVRLLDTEGLDHLGENTVALLALYVGSDGDTYRLVLEKV